MEFSLLNSCPANTTFFIKKKKNYYYFLIKKDHTEFLVGFNHILGSQASTCITREPGANSCIDFDASVQFFRMYLSVLKERSAKRVFTE